MQCDGKCYLKKSITKSQQEKQNKPFPLPHDNTPGILHPDFIQFSQTTIESKITIAATASSVLLPGVLNDISHPPEVLPLI